VGKRVYEIGDKIVHPMHGAGVIESIVEEKISGKLIPFYVFKMPISGLTLKIPTANSEMIGIRAVSSKADIEAVIEKIPGLGIDMTANWNHRYRENMERIKSGDLLEVAGVIKALMHRDNERGLSNGERKMLHSAKQILISEIVLAESVAYADAEARVNAVMLAKEMAV
jgi:CarD family transcriptional regulator